jgi:hypothetical protein
MVLAPCSSPWMQVTRIYDECPNLDRFVDFDPTNVGMSDDRSRGEELEAQLLGLR